MPQTTSAHVLVVDDEPDLRTLYELALVREGYHVHTVGSLQQARMVLQNQKFDVVLIDMRLPDGLGLTLLQEIVAQPAAPRCIMVTAYSSAQNAVEALKAGAFDYLTKPVDMQQFRHLVATASQQQVPLVRVPSGGSGEQAIARLVGSSDVMARVKARILKVAPSMAPVLVQGESGTGKELVARAIHQASHRASGPFIAVNCAAIPENLLEAEFFGAKKGSYTGATHDREGYFQAARAGTLFLDEIGDLPLAMQSKLLRVVQERAVRSLGATQEEATDVRIISATHKDVAQEVQAGRFRQDLFYRLNVIGLSLPPLRERREDLPQLCQALLAKISAESGLIVPPVSDALLQQLQRQPLKGNVRELENLLYRAVALSDGESLSLDDVEVNVLPSQGSGAGVPDNLQDYLDQQEREILLKTLQETQFNRTTAAARLGLSLRQIRYRMARLGITSPLASDE